MQDEQNKKTDIQLWDLVKNSTKKLETNNNYFLKPKNVVSKNILPASNQKSPSSINVSPKKENFTESSKDQNMFLKNLRRILIV